MIRIAQATSSETYTKYGKAPNQRRTGVTTTKPEGNLDGELNIVEWYGPWEKVYRAVDPAVAEKIANFFYHAVANGSHIGYSWSGNTELFDAMKAKGTDDPMDVDTPVNTDCCALAGAAIDHAGIHDGGLRSMTTWKMDEVLSRTNAFTVLTAKELCESGVGVQRGDLLWKTGHVACALDSDTSGLKDLMVFERFNFYGVTISAGAIGTRGAQMSKPCAKAGYKPIVARLTYVSDSSLANVVPFFGNGDNDKTLHVNFYRAKLAKCTVDAGVIVVYVRDEVVK